MNLELCEAETDEESLKAAFSKYGNVEKVNIPRDDEEKLRGFVTNRLFVFFGHLMFFECYLVNFTWFPAFFFI